MYIMGIHVWLLRTSVRLREDLLIRVICVQIAKACIENYVTCEGWHFTHMHHRIISLRGEIWAHKGGLTPPLFFNEDPVLSQQSGWSCDIVLWLPIWLLSMYDFSIGF